MRTVFHNQSTAGIALFFAVVFVSVVLAITLGVSDLVFGEQIIAKDLRDSRRAFYFADAGVECMLYAWAEGQLDAPGTPVMINCFGQSVTLPADTTGGTTVRNVLVTLTGGSCVDLEVKRTPPQGPTQLPTYQLYARGQTVCIPGARSVQFSRLWHL